jgi:hypothetical protein
MIREKADPLALFAGWYADAEKSEPNDPSAMSLATVGPDGMPAVRMVLLKDYDASGFVFYTNRQSRKGEHLLERPKAALLFHWKSLRRQVRLEGPVSPTTPQELGLGPVASAGEPLCARETGGGVHRPPRHRHGAAAVALVGLPSGAAFDRVLAGRALPPARPP